jgi:RNA polymerase-interacting CarD/CdnL/TRCF family regulator
LSDDDSLGIETCSNVHCHLLSCVWLKCFIVTLSEPCHTVRCPIKSKLKTDCRLTVQNNFVNRPRSVLRSCLLQAKAFSYFCRRFCVRKVVTRQVIRIAGNIKTCWRKNFQRGKEMSSELLWEFVVSYYGSL